MGVLLCLLLGLLGLVAVESQDCSKPLGKPNMDLGDNDILRDTFPDGTKVTFNCNPGYQRVSGSRTITCTKGVWSDLTLECDRKYCGNIGEVANGVVDYTGSQFGDKATIICNRGYSLVGKAEIRCGEQGWEGRLPVCEVAICDPPPPVKNAYVQPVKDSYDFNDILTYTCQSGFTLNGSRSIVCSDNGQFDRAPPTCIKVECQEPVIANAEWVSGARPPYGYQASVIYECNSGYVMKGPSTMTCGLDNQWSPGLLTCELVTCRPPSSVAAGSFSPIKESYQYQDVVEFSCGEGFSLSGSKSVTCSSDGTFKPAPPTCRIVTCRPPSSVAAGSFSPIKESYQYQDVVVFSCGEGFSLSGSKSVTCSSDGTFKPAPPTCHIVMCRPPSSVADGSFSPIKESYQYQDVVVFSCGEGFSLSGSKSVTCSSDGTFKPAPPTCHRSVSPSKAPTTTTTGPPTVQDDGVAWKVILGVLASLLVIGGGGYFAYRRCHRKDPDDKPPNPNEENVALSGARAVETSAGSGQDKPGTQP